MPSFEVDWSYKSEVFGTDVIVADDREDAEYKAIEKVRDEVPDASSIEVDGIREIPNGN